MSRFCTIMRSAIAVAVLAISWFGTGADGCLPTPMAFCNRTKADLTGWDHCRSAGVFKSVSKCYMNGGVTVNRYDFYKCQRRNDGAGFFLYRLCCPGPVAPTTDGTDVFNRYDESTGRCSLPTPPPPSPTTTMGSSATDSSSDMTSPSSDMTSPSSDMTSPSSDMTSPGSDMTSPSDMTSASTVSSP